MVIIMNKEHDKCEICGKNLQLLTESHEIKKVKCNFCNKVEKSEVICPDGHYICNECHAKDSIEILQKAIDKTIKISSNFKNCRPKFVVHLGGMSLDEVTGKGKISTMMDRAVENFQRLNFNPDDIEILPENLPPRPWYLGGQWFQYGFMYADDMIDFCNHFNLKMTYDVCHAALHCNHDIITLEEYTEKVLPLVSHLHLSDALGIDGEGVQIGEGDVNFDSFFEKLKNNNNQDFSWVTEIWSGHVNHGSGCRHSMHSLARYNNII